MYYNFTLSLQHQVFSYRKLIFFSLFFECFHSLFLLFLFINPLVIPPWQSPPCGKCNRPVAKNHKAIQCDICDKWIHIKCNSLKNSDYVHYQNLLMNMNNSFVLTVFQKMFHFPTSIITSFLFQLKRGSLTPMIVI